jgi:S-DNA-T family DNA segregation ATPase FtsK/SpoIIIE
MAARKSTKRTKRAKTTRRSKPKGPMLSAEAQREISAVFLGLLALLIAFACFNFGGSLVMSMFHSLRVFMGYSAYLLPVVFGSLAWMLFQPGKYSVRGVNYVGFVGLLGSLSGLFHIGLGMADAQSAAVGMGGGYLGYAITNSMFKVLNVFASAIVLAAFMAVFLILATNTNLKALFGAILAGFTREAKPVDEDATASIAAKGLELDLKVNNNSGSPMTSLPMRGELNLGNSKPPMAAAPVMGVIKPVGTPVAEQEALTSNTDEAWEGPSLDLLQATSSEADAGDVNANAKIIKKTMESFGIKVNMDEVNIGPTVTQYTFIPPDGVKLNKITGLDTNLALSLAAHPIRIEAPIPGKSAVGVEIPNKKIATVRLRDVLSSPEIASKKEPLTFVLGRDVSGTPMSADLAAMPHMLIAGATGSGKSVMINALLTSLLYRNAPADMKLILVDPKRVELGLYNDIPHLLTPVIVEPEKCISALKWAVAEMERRYKLLAEVGNRNIVEYNTEHKEDSMPYIVIVIDELADLMVLAAADVETLIVRLAQMARAVGIHLVLATQRPSVDVITGIIKANIPARLAFSVASQIDSRTILDQMGAEKLLGKGDMLFSSPDFIKPRRIQGVFLDNEETKAITDYLRSVRAPQYNEEVLSQKVSIGGRSGGGGGEIGEPDDDMFDDAAAAVFSAGKASASMLQRRLRVGYARAARLLDLLEERGIIGPADGARPRDVLISSLDQVHATSVAGPSVAEVMRPAEPYED